MRQQEFNVQPEVGEGVPNVCVSSLRSSPLKFCVQSAGGVVVMSVGWCVDGSYVSLSQQEQWLHSL